MGSFLVRKAVVPLTGFLLLVAIAAAILWFARSPDYEPAITSLALLATITGLFVDRWLSAKERRSALLHALVHELGKNIVMFHDGSFKPTDNPKPVPKLFPRFYLSVLETVISSGAFAGVQDRTLYDLLHSWMLHARTANQRLDVTELSTFVNPSYDTTAAFNKAIAESKPLEEAKQVLFELCRLLLTSYKHEIAACGGVDVLGQINA